MILKEIIKKNQFIYPMITRLRKFQYDSIPLISYRIEFNLKKILRVWGIDRKSKYEKLKDIRNKHKDERCFIIATGPSLKIEDLNKLKNEITISMNSICLAFNETEWRPTYYGIQDVGVFKRFEEQIKEFNCSGKFIGNTISKPMNLLEEYYYFPLNLLNHSYTHKNYNTKFSDDAFAVVYDGYSITYSLIQLAVYMGFNEIYLLGTDCNYSSNMNHHFKNYDHVDPSFLSAGDKMLTAYWEAKKFADKNNIKIYNATRGGKLEVFERVDLDFIL